MSDSVDATPDVDTGTSIAVQPGKVSALEANLQGMKLRETADTSEDTYRYKMDHPERGEFILINNRDFRSSRYEKRRGTDIDAAQLIEDFKAMGFNVRYMENLKSDEMLQIMIQANRDDHSYRDCIAVAVLTHGEKGTLCGIDSSIPIENFVNPLKKCPSLAGKPKIFIFQACQGHLFDEGQEVDDAEADPPTAQRIPLEADCLYAYSTVPGYFAWRNSEKGSWFVQALHKMIDRYILQTKEPEMDFARLLTRVNHEVAYQFESNAAAPHMSRKKQVPSIVSMLTKDLYFTKR